MFKTMHRQITYYKTNQTKNNYELHQLLLIKTELIIKEACVNNYNELTAALQRGANRIELCDNLHQGGTTPSYGTIKLSSQYNIVVMIRPRGGDFVYSQDELEIMKQDIIICKQLGVQQIVTGILTQTNQIDVEQMKNIIEIAQPMQVIFHMAIDECDDYLYRIKRVLTKGGKYKSAIDGKESIKYIIQKFPQLTILAGGGITKDNYQELVKYCGLNEVHGTKIV